MEILFHQDFPEIARGPISKKLHIWVFLGPVYFLVAIEFNHDEMLLESMIQIPRCLCCKNTPNLANAASPRH